MAAAARAVYAHGTDGVAATATCDTGTSRGTVEETPLTATQVAALAHTLLGARCAGVPRVEVENLDLEQPLACVLRLGIATALEGIVAGTVLFPLMCLPAFQSCGTREFLARVAQVLIVCKHAHAGAEIQIVRYSTARLRTAGLLPLFTLADIHAAATAGMALDVLGRVVDATAPNADAGAARIACASALGVRWEEPHA